MKKYNKQRLFEVMGKVDKTFKPRLNEDAGASVPDGQRPLYQIAREIRQDWGNKIYFGAVPYLQAMSQLDSINDMYGLDSAKSIVLYFLANAQTWRGETAKRIKAELKKMAGLRESVLNETGEWTGDEDDMAWMEAVKSDVQKIERATNGKLKLLDVRGFDKYQGPYAVVEINGRRYNIWSTEPMFGDYGNLPLWIENYPVDNTSREGMNAGFMGTSDSIIDMLNSETPQKNEADGMVFGTDTMPQPMYESEPKLYERDWKRWSREKTAGEYDRGDYYEVENGQLIDVEEYDREEHGEIMGRYNSKGQKVDIETGYPLEEPSTSKPTISTPKEPIPVKPELTPEQTVKDERKITDALIDAGFFNSKMGDTWVNAYDQGQNWSGWHEMDRFLKAGAEKGLWSEESAENYAKKVWHTYD